MKSYYFNVLRIHAIQSQFCDVSALVFLNCLYFVAGKCPIQWQGNL